MRRNVTILHMAEALQQVSYLCDQRKYQEALNLVQEIKPGVWQIVTEEGDEELQEDVKLLSKYETMLQRLVEVANATSVSGEDEDPLGGMCCAPVMALGMLPLALGMMWIGRRNQFRTHFLQRFNLFSIYYTREQQVGQPRPT